MSERVSNQAHIPRNNRNPRKRAQSAKHQRHDPPRREPLRQGARRLRRACQIEPVLRVARRVADDGDILRLAGGVVVGGDGEGGGLEEGGGFDHCCDEAGCEVPFDVAVEEPDAWREGVC